MAAVTTDTGKARSSTSAASRSHPSGAASRQIAVIDSAPRSVRNRTAAASVPPVKSRLASIEDQVQAARRIYNADVRLYLTRRGRFPGALVRRLGAFDERPYFELDHTRERGVATLSLAQA